MTFFFVRDAGHRYRFFSTEPVLDIQVRFSRWRRLWTLAKKKLMLLPQRTIRQEQALARIVRLKADGVRILHAARTEEKRIRFRFFLFIQRQRTKHIFLLAGETLLLPLSGLAMILPGPNVFFFALALLIAAHWQAFRGIQHLARKEHEFEASPLLSEWEEAVEERREDLFHGLLAKIGREYGLPDIDKVLWPERR